MAAKKKAIKKTTKSVTLKQLYTRARKDRKFFARLLEDPEEALRDEGLELEAADAKSLRRFLRDKPFTVKMSNRKAAQLLGDEAAWKLGPIAWPVIPWWEKGPLDPWKPGPE